MAETDSLPVCTVIGVGPGNGEAFARAFAGAGYAVALVARRADTIEVLANDLPGARAYVCDVSDEAAVGALFAAIAVDMGTIDTLIYNAGKGVWGAIDQVSTADFEAAWRTNTLGLFLCARAVIPAMRKAGQGNILVTGATASMRGVAMTAAFAPAKNAQRALTQSMARHLGPQGIHVAHIVVDGVVGGPETRAQFASRAEDGFIDPAAIAQIALDLARQPRSAWSFEVDVRPFNEKW